MEFPRNQEIWKSVNGFKKYEVSSFGRVRNAKTEKMLTQTPTEQGYLRVLFTKNGEVSRCRVHRLVAEAFIPNPEEKPFVDHIDGDRSNNIYENLRYATASENCANRKRKDGKELPKGVFLVKGKYRVGVEKHGKQYHVGFFKTVEEAKDAYERKAIELHGEFARFD